MIPLIDIQLSTVPSLYTLSTTTDPPSGAPDNHVTPPPQKSSIPQMSGL